MKADPVLQYEAIADGLATAGYSVIDCFLSCAEVDAIVSSREFQNGIVDFKKAGVGIIKNINESVRGDYIKWIDRSISSPAIDLFLRKLQDLTAFVNGSLFLSLKDFEVHATIYPAGSFYRRHLDQFKLSDHRKLSIICYLNSDWMPDHGGQLRLYLPGGTLDILPEAGRLVCFRSDLIEHEVLPATRDRLSLTGWLLDQLGDLKI